MVVMSMEAYEQDRYESEIYLKLREAEIEATSTTRRHSLEEVMDSMEKIISEAELDLKNKKVVKENWVEIHRVLYSRRNIDSVLQDE